MGGPVRLRVSGRSSDLSRIQIHQVASAFRTAVPDIEITSHFRESLGDKMQHDPLWSMPEKGVFTEDFVEDLRTGRTDLVVHSWKDLPTERAHGTRVVATLPRADTRDVLLVRRDRWRTVESGSKISILSSSPRRAHNLTPFLAWALPIQNLEIEFAPVRGNVPTRIRKLIEAEHHGLVVAKAALDRLLSSTAGEFASMRELSVGAAAETRQVIRADSLRIGDEPLDPGSRALTARTFLRADRKVLELPEHLRLTDER